LIKIISKFLNLYLKPIPKIDKNIASSFYHLYSYYN
jgi:hypothetical protein